MTRSITHDAVEHLRGDFFAIFRFNDAPPRGPREDAQRDHRGDGKRLTPSPNVVPRRLGFHSAAAAGYDQDGSYGISCVRTFC
jgi:hypothetical protein